MWLLLARAVTFWVLSAERPQKLLAAEFMYLLVHAEGLLQLRKACTGHQQICTGVMTRLCQDLSPPAICNPPSPCM